MSETPSKLLATVPTVSGKTTTPDAARQKINNVDDKRITVEDPGEYQLPALGLLIEPVHVHDSAASSDEALEENARMLEAVLADFGVKGRIVAVRPGPVVTLYEFEPAAGVKSSRVISLSDDVARSMSAVAARIAAIPGRNVLGVELPNALRETVFLRELLGSPEYEKARAPLILALGKTIGGEAVMADLAKMPHLLIAGTTGSGKSVALNTMILSLLYRMPPEQCRLIMIDPKMLELSVYDGIPHLLTPVVTDPKKAVVALKWAVREMEERYKRMAKLGVRNIDGYNARLLEAKSRGEELTRTVHTGFEKETGIKVGLVLKGSGESFAQIAAEKANPKLDVWFGGTGDPHLEHIFAGHMRENPGRINVQLRFDTALAQRVYSGSDVFLMPSRYEPGGLAHLIAMRYASKTGDVVPEANLNGSARAIAGILSPNLRVLGLMPHPEDLVDPLMGGIDGKPLFDALAAA